VNGTVRGRFRDRRGRWRGEERLAKKVEMGAKGFERGEWRVWGEVRVRLGWLLSGEWKQSKVDGKEELLMIGVWLRAKDKR
jgi:hypothetical protein